MKTKTAIRGAMTALFISSGMLMSSCVDNDYDLSDVDLTLGLGGDELTLPTNSTREIMVDEFLKASGNVVIQDNGDYVFSQKGNNVDPTKVCVDPVTIAENNFETTNIPLNVQQESNPGPRKAKSVHERVDAYIFDYSATLPDEIVALVSSKVRGEFTLKLHAPQKVRDMFTEIDYIKLSLPSGFSLGGIKLKGGDLAIEEGDQYVLTLTNLDMNNDIVLSIPLEELFFTPTNTGKGVYVDLKNRKIGISGEVSAEVYIAPEHIVGANGAPARAPRKVEGEDDLYLETTGGLSDITILSATGKFHPTIDMQTVGNVQVTGVPDYLTEDGVVVDLANPQVRVNVESDLCVGGFLTGKMTAIKDGAVIAQVSVPNMTVRPNATTSICICRDQQLLEQEEGVDYYNVPNLSDIIKTIPDEIKFDVEAEADSSQNVYYELGKTYTIRTNYNVHAPLAFGPEGIIVYRDTLNDWNSTLEDMELADKAYLELTTNMVNKLPADLHLSVVPIDVNGRSLASRIKVEVTTDAKDNLVLAATDGSKTTKARVRISANKPADLRQLDGVIYTIQGKANSQLVGTVVNAKKHSIQAKDIKIRLVGKLIIDAN